jgi:hypothetical protein
VIDDRIIDLVLLGTGMPGVNGLERGSTRNIQTRGAMNGKTKYFQR